MCRTFFLFILDQKRNLFHINSDIRHQWNHCDTHSWLVIRQNSQAWLFQWDSVNIHTILPIPSWCHTNLTDFPYFYSRDCADTCQYRSCKCHAGEYFRVKPHSIALICLLHVQYEWFQHGLVKPYFMSIWERVIRDWNLTKITGILFPPLLE